MGLFSVCMHIRPGIECFRAKCTRIQNLAGVHRHMLLQSYSSFECFITECTFELAFAQMNETFVFRNRVSGRTFFATDITLMLLTLVLMISHVSTHSVFIFHPCFANWALYFWQILPQVFQLVFLKEYTAFENPRTNLAHMCIRMTMDDPLVCPQQGVRCVSAIRNNRFCN